MKKTLAGLVCCALLCTGLLTAPASAAAPADQEQFTDGDYTFTKVSAEIVPAGIAAYRTGYTLLMYSPGNEAVSFSDGLMLVKSIEEGGGENRFDYLGTDGKLHDLNRGRFQEMCSFSHGLAAVIDKNGKMGFINTAGEIVIPCQFEHPYNQVGYSYGSNFHDETAWVLSYDGGFDESKLWRGGVLNVTWKQIDKTGKAVPGVEKKGTVGLDGPTKQEVGTYGLFCPDQTTMGLSGFTEEVESPKAGTFHVRFGASDTGLTYLPTGKNDANGEPETVLYVVSRKAENPPAKAGLNIRIDKDSGFLLDNGVAYSYTLTNNSDEALKGYYALLSYDPQMRLQKNETKPVFYGQLHQFNIDLAPHEVFEGRYEKGLVSNFWGMSQMNLLWIRFDNKSEQDAFFADSVIGAPSNNFGTGYYSIDSSNGAQWMKEHFNITIRPVK